jgi:hypothetical protein
MRDSSKVLTAKEIRALNIQKNDVLNHDIEFGCFFITIKGERIASFSNSLVRFKTTRKIQRMGLGLGVIELGNSDEENGLIQANELGLKTFECKILS